MTHTTRLPISTLLTQPARLGSLVLSTGVSLAIVLTTTTAARALPELQPPGVMAFNPLHLAQTIPGSEGGTGGGPTTETDLDSEPDAPSAGRRGAGAVGAVVSPAASPTNTQTIVSLVESISQTCRPVDAAYRVDCVASELKVVAEQLPDTGDYNEARKILEDAADDLEDLARRNIDRTQPRVRVKLPPESGRPVTEALAAVKPDVVAETNAAAIEILDNTTTILLRSAENSESRAIHYQQIAEAVDSNKVLLRS